MLTVTVTTRSGEYAMGLKQSAFQINDEKQPRTIEFFESDDSPLSAGILIDTSASMQVFQLRDVARAGPMVAAITELLRFSNEKNEYFLAAFDRDARFLTDWKNGTTLLSEPLGITSNGKITSMYDACFAAIEKLQNAHNSRRVLMLFSDGLDNGSRHSFVELRKLLRDSDVALYAIGIYAPEDVSTLGQEGKSILEELAEVTGGQAFFPKDMKEMLVVMNMLATQLHHQYRLGIRPSSIDPPNKWHRIQIRINLPQDAPAEFSKLTLRTRQGYYTH